MAEQSGFFDAHLVDGQYDRVYLAESFAKYFASFIGNGIFGGKSSELIVRQKQTADMSVRVMSGQSWINGYWYENTDELSLAIDIADGVLNRIDLIVLRWNNSERVVRLAVKKGVPATQASAPTLQRDADIYELMLAQVSIKAGTTSITQINITDTRLNSDVCGLVHAVVDQLDATEFGIQLSSYIEQFITEHDAWFTQFKADCNADVNNLLTESQGKVNKLLADGQTNINSVVTTGQQNIAKVVSDGSTNINKVITDGQTNINNVVNKGTTDINSLISTKSAEIDEVISNGQQRFDDVTAELEELAKDNEFVQLRQDVNGAQTNIVNINDRVQALEKLSIESGQFPGCFYRIRDGVTEWINPPIMPGFEYLTVEKWNGNSVYQRTIYAATLPNKTVMSVHVNSYFDEIVSITGFAIDSDNNMHYQFPIILNGLTPAAVISFAEGDGGDGSDITINTNDDLTSFKAYITVKYTKKVRA